MLGHRFAQFVLAGAMGLMLTSCSKERHPDPGKLSSQPELTLITTVPGPASAPPPSTSPAPTALPSAAPPPAGASAPAGDTRASGSLEIRPNPVPVCDKTGAGRGTVSWRVSGAEIVEIHVERPDGTLFAKGGSEGSARTEDWVRKDMTFYLQDVTGGAPLDAAHTIARLTPGVTGGGPCK